MMTQLHPSLVLLHLVAAILLLVWAVRMVRTGMERAHGTRLKRALRGNADAPYLAALTGAALAVLLQSSTAVALLASGFATSGILSVPAGIATLLGADLGSALVVAILSWDLQWLVPILIIAGVTLFLKFESRTLRQSGRIVLGIAFILISLRMIGEATLPLRESGVFPVVAAYLESDPLTACLVAALFAWLVHSSVATLLMLAAIAAQGALPPAAALPMVLGANIGAGIVGIWLTRGMEVTARRIPLGNFLFRTVAALILLAAEMAFGLSGRVAVISSGFGVTGLDGAWLIVGYHLAFNALLLILCLPLAGSMARICNRLLPAIPLAGEGALPPAVSALDRSVMDKPNLALASATREVLRMGETVERMLFPVMDLFDQDSAQRLEGVRSLYREVNAMHGAIKLFIAEVNRGLLNEEDATRGIELTDFAINLEHAGDTISRSIVPLIGEKHRKKLAFSEEGRNEMAEIHARVMTTMKLALNVLVSRDRESARQLVREKEAMRRLERESHDRHLRRLQSGRVESIETSDIHLEMVRNLKEINSLMVTVAYPILADSGELLDSRLA